jgi:signal peptidase I
MKRLFGKLLTIGCAAALVFVLLAILLPSLLGLQRYIITGGSMTGTIAKGSVVYARITPADQLKVGDIITFHPPGCATAVTHRIIAISADVSGARTLSTKGDFNKSADPWNPIVLNEPTQARYVFHVPVLGYVLAALALRNVRLLVIGIPAVLIALSLLWSLWHEAGEEVVRQLAEQGDGLPHDARSRA